MVSGAHRKLATQISAPSLTQHLAFRIPDPYAGDRKAWVGHAETFILALYDELCRRSVDEDPGLFSKTINLQTKNGRLYLLENSYPADPADPSHKVPALITEYPTRYQTVRFSFLWQSMPVHTSFELRDEYLTLSTTVDLSQWKMGIVLGETLDREPLTPDAALAAAIEQFGKITTERFRQVRKGMGLDERSRTEDRKSLEDAYHTIYHATWDRLHDDIFSEPLKTVGTENIGRIFADFRSFVAARGRKEFIMLPGTASAVRAAVTRPFRPNEDIQCVDTILPFLRVGEGDDPPRPIEHTFSRFLDSRCIYGTALGAQPPTLQAEIKPLTYVVLSTHSDPWQLGRFVNDINTLGTLRLAALFDLDHLTQADARLADSQQTLRGIGARLSNVMKEDDRYAAIAAIASDLLDASQKLNAAGRDIPGGLAARVNRSRDYRGEFQNLLPALDIAPIGGFQPYDQFVERRLGDTYDSIHRIGERFERLRDAVTALERRSVSTELLQLQGQITNQTGTIEKLQEGADFVFFLAPFPYYLSSFVLHAFDEKYLAENPSWKHGILAASAGLGTGLAFRGELKAGFKYCAKQLHQKSTALWRDSKIIMLDPRVVSSLELARGPIQPSPS